MSDKSCRIDSILNQMPVSFQTHSPNENGTEARGHLFFHLVTHIKYHSEKSCRTGNNNNNKKNKQWPCISRAVIFNTTVPNSFPIYMTKFRAPLLGEAFARQLAPVSITLQHLFASRIN